MILQLNPQIITQLVSYAIVAGFSISLYTFFHAQTKKPHPKTNKILLIGVFFGYIFFILSITLLFRDQTTYNIELDPIASYRRALNAPLHLSLIEIRNLILNTAMFVPIGFMLALLFINLNKMYITVILSLLFTLSIELIQFFTHRGVFAIEDIIHNTLGAVIGYFLYLLMRHVGRQAGKPRPY